MRILFIILSAFMIIALCQNSIAFGLCCGVMAIMLLIIICADIICDKIDELK